MNRNLIVLRCGRNSLHWQWLETDARNWDIVLCPYQEMDARGLESHLFPGQKWSGLHQFLNAFPNWRNYDYICLPDDDIAADGATWNRFFDWCGRLEADLAMPALTQDSYASHAITLQNVEFLARATTFVEIMNPCFSRKFLEAALPTFALSRLGSGFGLDLLWPLMLAYKNVWIVDGAAVRHTRPVSSGRDKSLATLARYDYARILGFGVPAETYNVTAGIDIHGRFRRSSEPGFETLHRRGYADIERRAPYWWLEFISKPFGPSPECNVGALARLRAAVAHLHASERPISRGKPCLTSSVSRWSWSDNPALEATGGNDGLLNGGCGFHTDLEVNPWWQVDLTAVHEMTSIVIYNRLDEKERCVDLDILASLDNRTWTVASSKRDGQEFGGLDGNPFRAQFTPAVRARFVRVQLVGRNFLHLDQVEIFGVVATDALSASESPRQSDDSNSVRESVIMLERALSDPRGEFLLQRLTERFMAKFMAERDSRETFVHEQIEKAAAGPSGAPESSATARPAA